MIATTTPGASTFTVTGTDRVGNVSTQNVAYLVAYNVCPQFDSSMAWRAGGIVPIRVQLCDFAGANVSSPSVIVTATGVTRLSDNAPGVLGDAGNSNPDVDFRYIGSGVSASYALNLSKRVYDRHLCPLVHGERRSDRARGDFPRPIGRAGASAGAGLKVSSVVITLPGYGH